jgi:hypothetical protein
MTETGTITTAPLARRKSIVMNANIGRVITRPYLPTVTATSGRTWSKIFNGWPALCRMSTSYPSNGGF